MTKPVGEPDSGNPHVRFDERGWETERCRMAQATAPILDSTDPEALGCASEFRLSRCCGLDALAVSLSLHDMGGSRKGPILRHLPDPRYYFNVHTRSCAA